MKPFLILLIIGVIALSGFLIIRALSKTSNTATTSANPAAGMTGPITANQQAWLNNPTLGKATTKEECDKRMRGICGGFPGISTEKRWWWLGCVCDVYDSYCFYNK